MLNGFFKKDDRRVTELSGHKLHDAWWSRPYEYAWAIQFAKSDHVVADMGCGWMFRPFKDALADKCEYVYAVDADYRLKSQRDRSNMEFIIADFTQEIEWIPHTSLDLIFCISVLEDLGTLASTALKEFYRLLKPDGLVLLTMDVPYNDSKPTPHYPGLPLPLFEQAMQEAGFRYASGKVDYEKENAVNHADYNLCVFHAVLEKTTHA